MFVIERYAVRKYWDELHRFDLLSEATEAFTMLKDEHESIGARIPLRLVEVKETAFVGE